MEKVAADINTLATFLGKRDVAELKKHILKEKYGFEKADVMVLFGGSIIAGGDVLADAIHNDIAGVYIIVGGAGHTTDTLRQAVHTEYPEIDTEGLTEAEIFQKYLSTIYKCNADYLETRSTNCGNNITYLLDLIKEKNIECNSIIICQDATMQNRMDAGMRMYSTDMEIINYAAYNAKVIFSNGKLDYADNIHGMWDIERYVNLLMGEIPRLTDNESGYGPNGRGFIVHVDVPESVREAFYRLQSTYGNVTREANPMFASK